MNIFENHIKEIENLVQKNKSHLRLKNLKPIRPSRIRTYIRDLEGPCPNPLDDGP